MSVVQPIIYDKSWCIPMITEIGIDGIGWVDNSKRNVVVEKTKDIKQIENETTTNNTNSGPFHLTTILKNGVPILFYQDLRYHPLTTNIDLKGVLGTMYKSEIDKQWFQIISSRIVLLMSKPNKPKSTIDTNNKSNTSTAAPTQPTQPPSTTTLDMSSATWEREVTFISIDRTTMSQIKSSQPITELWTFNFLKHNRIFLGCWML